jgi:hypothetical protein
MDMSQVHVLADQQEKLHAYPVLHMQSSSSQDHGTCEKNYGDQFGPERVHACDASHKSCSSICLILFVSCLKPRVTVMAMAYHC